MSAIAKVLAEHLGLTPENAPWAFGEYVKCLSCEEYGSRNAEGECDACWSHPEWEEGHRLTAPSPFAPDRQADCWLGELVRMDCFCSIGKNDKLLDFDAYILIGKDVCADMGNTPTAAIVRAMMAADPEFNAAMEAAIKEEEKK